MPLLTIYLFKHNAECIHDWCVSVFWVHVYWSVNNSFCDVWSAVSTSDQSQLACVGCCTLWMSQCGIFNSCSVLPPTDCVLIEENFSMKCKKHKVSRNYRALKCPFLVKMDMLKLQGVCVVCCLKLCDLCYQLNINCGDPSSEQDLQSPSREPTGWQVTTLAETSWG